MPDGRVIRNVPDGVTRSELTRRLAKMDGGGDAPQPAPYVDDSSMLSKVRDATGNSEVLRSVGVAGGLMAEGITFLPQLPLHIINAVAAASGLEARAMTLGDVLNKLGAAQPRDELEQGVANVGRAVASVGGGVVAGKILEQGVNQTAQRIGQVLQSSPGMQTASALTGGTSAEVARQKGYGPVGQTVAGMAGALAPPLASAGGSALTRGLYRGGESGRQKVEQNIRDFEQSGTAPTVGQATEGRFAQGTESLMSRTPGSAGPIARKAINQAEQIGAKVSSIADDLSSDPSAMGAGQSITTGIRGTGGFVEKFKVNQNALYAELDNYVPKATPVNVAKTKAALQALNADIPNAPNISKWFKNSKIVGIEGALTKDTPEGTLPYEAVQKLRTLVGNELADNTIMSDVPRSKWKAFYAAISDDIGGAVSGDPKAQTAWQKANNYTRAGMRRLEAIDNVVSRAEPERVFLAATSGTKDGATTIRNVMKMLPDAARKDVAATVLKRMGQATAGNQNEVGSKFSMQTFLTNWAKLDPSAKGVLFARIGPKYNRDIEAISRAAANIRDGSKVFQNPSGTEQATAQAAVAGSVAAAVVTGNVSLLATIGSGVLGANLTARLMVNPNFVGWLAQSTKLPTGLIPAQINQLAKSADPLLQEAAAALKKGQTQQDQKQEREQQGQ